LLVVVHFVSLGSMYFNLAFRVTGCQVFFMDTQFWYSVLCAIFGGFYGILNHLGEIRTLRMLRIRFLSLPSALNSRLIPPSFRNDRDRGGRYPFHHLFQKDHRNEDNDFVKFAIVWNRIITSFRQEDLLSNREMDLMMIPLPSESCPDRVRWPVFLLANKLATALSIARDFTGKDEDLFNQIMNDIQMNYAVKECYESFKYILQALVVGEIEKRIVFGILEEIEDCSNAFSLLKCIRMSELPALRSKCIELIVLLAEGDEQHHAKVVKVLQDIFELVTCDMLINGSRTLDHLYSSLQSEEYDADFHWNIHLDLFASKNSIRFPFADNVCLLDQIKRLMLLLTVNDTALDIPVNLEARRRISFFATSLFMKMPCAPKVCNMLSFSVLTPHYMEDVKYSLKELRSSQGQVSIIFYMQKIYPDEWQNFLERMRVETFDALKSENKEDVLRDWTSFRGQTLSRTVRGMMYYRKALKLQAFLDMTNEEDILRVYHTIEGGNDALSAQLDALVDMKFTYIISCQMYPSLRVAYVEEKELVVADKAKKVYSSVLVKAVNHLDQDNYLEEAFKVRNVLQEFLPLKGHRHPTIIGLREHIFTGSVSSLAWFMSYQETSFVTIGQRLLANPLRVRFHYGHPDFFDRIFHIARGGISKASKTINLSEDVFAGFNSVLRRGYITYHEYMQIGKGRDVGLNQISQFEAKVANGNSGQTISRDIHRLGRRFDFFRMLSLYFTTVGFYCSSLVSVVAVYVFLYGHLYLILSGVQKALLIETRFHYIKSLETALASQSFIQLGLLTGLPMVMEIGLEKGFLTAIQDFVLMQFQLAAVFFMFSFGTKTHYYGRTILHGGAKYRPTGRKVVIFHTSFTQNYRLYSRSHFIKGFELMLLLTVYDTFRQPYQSGMGYSSISYAIWFISLSWLFAPFLFNPSGFNWQRIVDDWMDWNKWIRQQGGIGIQQDQSWQSWWDDEQAHLRRAGLISRLIEVLLSLRFFLYQYGLVYHLNITRHNKNLIVYMLSWVFIVVVFVLVKVNFFPV
ncbi:Putative callose synthase 8, partial [Dionaea muscipula]